jgi:hypothetical protein
MMVGLIINASLVPSSRAKHSVAEGSTLVNDGLLSYFIFFHLFLDKKVEPKIKAMKKLAKNNFVSLNPPNSPRSCKQLLSLHGLEQWRLFNGLRNCFLNAIFSRPPGIRLSPSQLSVFRLWHLLTFADS